MASLSNDTKPDISPPTSPPTSTSTQSSPPTPSPKTWTITLPRIALPSLLLSDTTAFLLFVVFNSSLIQSLPPAIHKIHTLHSRLSRLREPVTTEWWDKEDLLAAKSHRWEPHRYLGRPPRLRSYREILNRQQALKNSCPAQATDLSVRDLLGGAALHVLLAAAWALTVLRDLWALVRLLRGRGVSPEMKARLEDSIPVVVRESEATMLAERRGDGEHPSLSRIQDRIDRSQQAVDSFQAKGLCGEGRKEWSETEWLCLAGTCDDVPESEREAVRLKSRAAFSVGVACLMTMISCDFAVFYSWALLHRVAAALLWPVGWAKSGLKRR